MSEEQTQVTEQEVATDSQTSTPAPDSGELIAESKKYRSRAQKAESRVSELEQSIEEGRQKQLEEQNQWKTLAEERKAAIDELSPIVDQYKADEAKYRDELLSDFSDDDRDTFKELPLSQLRAVHGKIISKPNVPNVDTSPAGAYGGYENLVQAAKDVSSGKLDKKSYAKIKDAFTSRISRA